MATKQRSSRQVYVCSSCGEEYVQWQGKCSSCGEWNTLKEVRIQAEARNSTRTPIAVEGVVLEKVSHESGNRIQTGYSEFDTVLGGGIVPGAVMLVGGDPGIGKSTLLLQIAGGFSGTVLYVAGEESPEQIKLRATRLSISGSNIVVHPSTDVSLLAEVVEKVSPGLMIIDSIQTTYDPAYPSTPGSLVQVRETALSIQRIAKHNHIPTVLVGHITKDGTVAGPRTLEHLVDVVLYLEGDAQSGLRLLRSVKNRFGDTSETGIFEMTEMGLREVANPNEFLLTDRESVSGSVLTAVLDGKKPILVEVQALVVPSTFATPRRTASGFDTNRLHMLLAVLQRRAGVDVSNHDVYVNIVGGIKVRETAVDAAVCVAVASARREAVISHTAVVVGEVGLSGEIRATAHASRRSKAVSQLGYELIADEKRIQALIERVIPRSGKR